MHLSAASATITLHLSFQIWWPSLVEIRHVFMLRSDCDLCDQVSVYDDTYLGPYMAIVTQFTNVITTETAGGVRHLNGHVHSRDLV